MRAQIFLLFIGFNCLLSSPVSKVNLSTKINYGTAEQTSRTQIENFPGDVPGLLIVGGEEATAHEFPYLVHLSTDNLFCGGTLIEMDLVLTSAYCMYYDNGTLIPTSKITVTAGDHILNRADGEETLPASWVRVHEDYIHRTDKNDIALVRVNRNFTESLNVVPIKLPTTTSSYGTVGTLAGWGADTAGEQIKNVLQKVEVPILSNCAEANKSIHLCAGEPGKGFCNGDSGGPMICRNIAGYHVCGIATDRIFSSCGERYDLFTYVSAYIPWIEEQLSTPVPTTTTISSSFSPSTDVSSSSSNSATSSSTTQSSPITISSSTSSPSSTTNQATTTNPSSSTTSPTTTTTTSTTTASTESSPSTTPCIPYDPTTDSDYTTDSSTDSTTDQSSPVTMCMPPATEPSSSTIIIGSKILPFVSIIVISMYC